MNSTQSTIDGLATEYVKIALAWSEKDDLFLDTYFGSPVLKNESKKLVQDQDLPKRAVALVDEIQAFEVKDSDAQRKQFLLGQALALATRARVMSGDTLPYWDEYRRVFGVEPPAFDPTTMDGIRKRLDRALPGSGPLHDRFFRYSDSLKVSPDQLQHVLELAFEECRRRTKANVELPEGEFLKLNFVTGEFYTAYQDFKANSVSVIHFNTDLPMRAYEIVDFAAHEAYPGHHSHYVSIEQLYRDNKWPELSLIPFHSPIILVAEGIAEMAYRMAFSPDEAVAFDRDVIYPAAGLDPALAEKGHLVNKLERALLPAAVAILREHLNGNINEKEAKTRLVEEALIRPKKAAKWISTSGSWRTYDAVYWQGLELVSSYVDLEGGDDQRKRWAAYERLLRAVPSPAALQSP